MKLHGNIHWTPRRKTIEASISLINLWLDLNFSRAMQQMHRVVACDCLNKAVQFPWIIAF
jgi:hypothetical protein